MLNQDKPQIELINFFKNCDEFRDAVLILQREQLIREWISSIVFESCHSRITNSRYRKDWNKLLWQNIDDWIVVDTMDSCALMTQLGALHIKILGMKPSTT